MYLVSVPTKFSLTMAGQEGWPLETKEISVSGQCTSREISGGGSSKREWGGSLHCKVRRAIPTVW